MENTGIKPVVIQEICGLAQKYGVEKVILFGSRARGDYKRTSDIDLACRGGDFNRFALDVDEETSTLLKYDIINLDMPIQKELGLSIIKEGRTIYEKI
ncbi:MAG TPA: nucleotidyltransferase domain-containing protein [Lachnospiraceae bacterium]|nr:nucleotidyltransferase domain-containing protein [Lachnospiraceae bacterium]